jgi:dCMP deaminase
MSRVAIAYVPVLHEGYRRFFAAHARGSRGFVVGRELFADYRPLAKDIRALHPDLAAAALASWGLCSDVAVLDADGAQRLAAEGPTTTIVLPAEDVSYLIVERFFAHLPVLYDSVFLRWDKSKTAMLARPRPTRESTVVEALAELLPLAEDAAARSLDWWRQVGAAIRFRDGSMTSATNEHQPRPCSPYVVGDPRSNFSKGVHLELSTAVHAEAGLIADAARGGVSTEGAVLYVTDFPCPPCAKLIAGAGIAKLFYRTGYALLDGNDVLADAGVEIVLVRDEQ